MPTVDLTTDSFEQTIVEHDFVLVDFWAEWCGPCRNFAPIYQEVSEDYPDIVFGKVDTEAEPQLADAFQIRSIPTLMIFRDQIGIYAQPGALPEETLRSLIDQAAQVDMDEVRQEVEEQEAASR